MVKRLVKALAGKFDKRAMCMEAEDAACYYEYCPSCEANLTLQKGYDNSVPYWICRGCGSMLINPSLEDESGIVWICDECGAMLNLQPGFGVRSGVGEEKWAGEAEWDWTCTECGHVSRICPEEVYLSEEEYKADCANPYKGLADEDVMRIMAFEDVRPMNAKENVMLVKDPESGAFYVKKIIKTYDRSIYEHLQEKNVPFMPQIYEIFEGNKNLIIIEEYIEGRTLAEILEERRLTEREALRVAIQIGRILEKLHSIEPPIIHRDVKPANIIVTDAADAFLLDVNATKWYKPGEAEDTKLLGTLYYAAPEQCGYGFEASTAKADVYAVGVLLNVMLTGKLPKEEKADGPLWDIIEGCLRLESEERYSDAELLAALEREVKRYAG